MLVEEWIQEWGKKEQEEGQYWNQIEKIVNEDKKYGLNVAYLYLNQFQ